MGIGALVGEAWPWNLLYGLAGMVFLWLAAGIVEWAWWGPQRMGRALRAQGLRGTSYRLLIGDLREETRLRKAARARPLPLDRAHHIVPRVAPLLHRAVQEHGKISFTWFGPSPRVTLADPVLVRQVLSDKFGHFEKTQSFRLVSRVLADGLIIHEGEKWVKHRRILNPAFHVEKLKLLSPAFSTCCIDLIKRWENSITSDGSCELDVWPEFQNFTGDVISRTAFGSNYQEGRRIFQLQAEQADRLMQTVQYMFIPGYSMLPTKNKRRVNEIDREIRALLRGIIGKREQAMKNGETNKDDLLGLLLESNLKYSDGDGKSTLGMTTEDVIGECKLFYFAGMETTSVLLTWTTVLLSMHPEWQCRAREEVFKVFGRNKPDFDGLSQLKIVTMILYEALRLYPPAILISRKACTKIELGGITYPPGVVFILPVVFIHHDPTIWGKDASEFNPERFAQGISKAGKDPVAFFPFSWGPRTCIGQNFALLEAKMAVSMILQHFSFELSSSYVHAPYTVITLHPQYGAPLRLKKL